MHSLFLQGKFFLEKDNLKDQKFLQENFSENDKLKDRKEGRKIILNLILKK